jgi:replicative DNA helicase
MELEKIIARIEREKKENQASLLNQEGLQRLQDVAAQYNGEYRLVWSDTLQEEIANRPKKQMHMTGVKEVDDLTGGFREQMLIGIGAHSGHGKTAMGLWLLKKYEFLNPVMIPLEQSAEELIEQRSANNQFIPRFLSPHKHSARATPEWIEERIVEGIAKYNTKLVLIDHMGYTDPDKEFMREQEPLRIERKLQAIKNLAKKWNVVIVMLIQISQLDESTPPSLLNLKGSSSIRQECDKVILLWRKNTLTGKVRVYQNETLFSLQKNRWSGKNGNCGLHFEHTTGEYIVTAQSKEWIRQMEEAAMRELQADEMFDS